MFDWLYVANGRVINREGVVDLVDLKQNSLLAADGQALAESRHCQRRRAPQVRLLSIPNFLILLRKVERGILRIRAARLSL